MRWKSAALPSTCAPCRLGPETPHTLLTRIRTRVASASALLLAADGSRVLQGGLVSGWGRQLSCRASGALLLAACPLLGCVLSWYLKCTPRLFVQEAIHLTLDRFPETLRLQLGVGGMGLLCPEGTLIRTGGQLHRLVPDTHLTGVRLQGRWAWPFECGGLRPHD